MIKCDKYKCEISGTPLDVMVELYVIVGNVMLLWNSSTVQKPKGLNVENFILYAVKTGIEDYKNETGDR